MRKPVKTFYKNGRRPIHWPILAFGGQKDTKNLAHSGHFWHTHENTHIVSRNQVYGFILKRFVKMAKKPPKFPLKQFEAKIQNSTCTTSWAILLCTFKPNIWKIGWKLREPIQFGKTVNGKTQTDGQMANGSVSDKLRWLCCQQWS